jgi:hypothetical protein
MFPDVRMSMIERASTLADIDIDAVWAVVVFMPVT